MTETKILTNKDFIDETILNKKLHNRIVRFIISLFIFALGLWLFSGIIHLVYEIKHSWNGPWESIVEKTIVNSLSMLALLEIIRTLQCYLEIGRVRVTFILDATLVALIGELIGLWYREYTLTDITTSIGVITALIVLRIVTTWFSPYLKNEHELAESM